MLYADMSGLYNVTRRHAAVRRDARRRTSAFWTPATLLRRLAAEGKTFNA
jgi:hypothetical protein